MSFQVSTSPMGKMIARQMLNNESDTTGSENVGAVAMLWCTRNEKYFKDAASDVSGHLARALFDADVSAAHFVFSFKQGQGWVIVPDRPTAPALKMFCKMAFAISYAGERNSSWRWLHSYRCPHQQVEIFDPSAGPGFCSATVWRGAIIRYFYGLLVLEDLSRKQQPSCTHGVHILSVTRQTFQLWAEKATAEGKE